MQQLFNIVFPKPILNPDCAVVWVQLPHFMCATKDILWVCGVIRCWPGHNSLQNGVIMTWLWYHDAGQTMTHLKTPNRQSRLQLLNQYDPLFVYVEHFSSLLLKPPSFLNYTFPSVHFTRNCYSGMFLYIWWWHGCQYLSVEWFAFWCSETAFRRPV